MSLQEYVETHCAEERAKIITSIVGNIMKETGEGLVEACSLIEIELGDYLKMKETLKQKELREKTYDSGIYETDLKDIENQIKALTEKKYELENKIYDLHKEGEADHKARYDGKKYFFGNTRLDPRRKQ